MDIEIEHLPHPKGIWTPIKGQRIWYFPYLQHIERLKGNQGWLVSYNGGEEIVELKKADTLMFYGTPGSLPLALLDECAKYGVTVVVQRTHIANPFVGGGSNRLDRDDLLTQQILRRENAKQSAYLARQLIRRKVLAQSWLLRPSDSTLSKIAQSRSVEGVRLVEAQAARRYWAAYFSALGLDEGRRQNGTVQASLNAGCRYLSGIVLRWVQAHSLSPAHGYLHVQTNYPALVADLMEPYRYCVDRPIFDLYQRAGEINPAAAVSAIKAYLAEQVTVEPTRQQVYRRGLLHGSVLALRHYLNGQMRRFIPPYEVDKTQGRKQKHSYKLIGEIR